MSTVKKSSKPVRNRESKELADVVSRLATCKCIQKIDEGLKKDGEELATAFSWSAGTAYPIIKTQRIGGGRGKTRILLPNFCPFCGVAYVEQPTRL